MGKAVTVQNDTYAFGDDDGSESGHTLDTENVDRSAQVADVTFLIRIQVEETAGGTEVLTAGLFAQKNGTGGFTEVTTSRTDGLKIANDTQSRSDDENTTNRLSAGAGSPDAGKYDDGQTQQGCTAVTLISEYADFEFAIQIDSAYASDSDYWDLRVGWTGGGDLDSYPGGGYPTVTASISAPITVNKDIQAKWDIYELVSKDSQAKWDINVLVYKDIQAKWDIVDLVYKDLQAIWDIVDLVYKDLQAVWDMSGAVHKDLQAVWDLLNLVYKDLQAKWDILNLVGKATQAVWDIYELVGKNLQAVWDMEGAVGKSLQAVWDISEFVNKNLQAVWDILNLVNKDIQMKWDIDNLVYKANEAVYDIAESVNKDLQAVWDMAGAVHKDLQARWDILGEGGAVRRARRGLMNTFYRIWRING